MIGLRKDCLHFICEQETLWLECANAHARLGLGCLLPGSMTFGRKPFGRNDVWSNVTFGRYDVSPTTTFVRLRQMVENSSNYVEI